MPGIDANTVLMLHLDNNVTDSELIPKTVTNNNVTFDNTVYKFGGFSGQFNGVNGTLQVPDSPDWCFQTGDFTIDFWFNSNSSILADQYLVMQGISGDYWVCYIDSTSKMFYASTYGTTNNGGSFVCTNSNTFTTGTWFHLAWVRSGASMLMFINGVGQAVTKNADFSPSSLTDFSSPLCIGGFPSTVPVAWINAKIDELRISKGIARWTTNFTPPTSPYDTSTGISFYRTLMGIGS